MKFIFDQNVPRKVVGQIAGIYAGSVHVMEVGLSRSDDGAIWDFAVEQGYAILTKDHDFFHRSMRYGHPPKVLWLRVGNARVEAIVDLLLSRRDEIIAFDMEQHSSLLILP